MFADLFTLLLAVTVCCAFPAVVAFSNPPDSVLRDAPLRPRVLVFVMLSAAMNAMLLPALLAMVALGAH